MNMYKQMAVIVVAAMCAGTTASARTADFSLATPNMAFEIDGDASNARFDFPRNTVRDKDFWRLILDDGARTEIPVFSHAQKGRVTREGKTLTVSYDRIVSDYGDTYDIGFSLRIKKEGDALSFTATIDNRSKVRVNECVAPLVSFNGLVGEKAKDVLYMPRSLGQRSPNPYGKMEGFTQHDYLHNEYEDVWRLHYPECSMCWLGIESGGKFLYIGRHDEQVRTCFLVVRHTIHGDDLMPGIVHLPMARPGEKLTFAPVMVGLLDGDWRAGAKRYRAWADTAFFKVQPKADWVRNMTGWQRVILKSQYGEDYYKFSDLPAMYEAGHKYGIDTLFLFAWWKGGMDSGYPIYEEPYPGAWRELKDGVAEVRRRGGCVILECNCNYVDVTGDFYKKHWRDILVRTINGGEQYGSHGYPGFGDFRFMHGARVFAAPCTGTKLWRDTLFSNIKLMHDAIDPDCLFLDCFGAYPTCPCFNGAHEHGPRVDHEWTFRRQFYDDAANYCDRVGRTLATEVVTDIAAAYTQFVHSGPPGFTDLNPHSEQFPALFRYTFPEVIVSNRGVRNAEGDFAKMLRNALVYGIRYDAELYVCRRTLDANPAYADIIGRCCRKMKEYGEFYFDGRFTVRDTSPLPPGVVRGEFLNKDGTKLLTVLHNASGKPVTVKGVSYPPGNLSFNITSLKNKE